MDFDTSVNTTDQQTKKRSVMLISIAVLIIAIVFLLIFYVSPQFKQSPGEVSAPGEIPATQAEVVLDLYETEGLFKVGRALENDGDHAGARLKYMEAMKAETDPVKKAHIHFRLARTTEKVDLFESIEYFKEIIADESYPDQQKSYAAMWLPLLINRHGDIKDVLLEDAAYAIFDDESLAVVYKNLYEFSLTFGSNGLAEFSVAKWHLREAEGLDLSSFEGGNHAAQARVLMAAGDDYIFNQSSDPVNSGLLPRIFRGAAGAYALLAKLGDEEAVARYDSDFEKAIEAGILSKLDGAIRFEYVLTAFDLEGEASFSKTQKHLDFLLANMHVFPGVQRYFEDEIDNFYGTKDDLRALANANATFKNYLITSAGWKGTDF
jgi:hypothetical protein